ncbi:MAG: hypothetical protein OXC12_14705 [Spirochaetaceae bacterium]|nr:hypothetical protein [Spirochaetaceae bacterium]
MQLPAAPAAWQHFAIILRLTAVDARDGTEQRLPDAVPGSVAVLPIGRHTATVIVAEPVVVGPAGAGSRGALLPPEGALRLRPAGAVVPLDVSSDGVLQVTWERGVLATLILDLWRGGANPWLLNIERLDRELRQRTGADPWALDRGAILAAVQAGEMSVSAIRPRPKHTVSVSFPAGRWVWWDPWATPLHSDGRTAFTIQLPAGYHLLVHDSGAARAVHVNEDGTVLTTPVADGFPRRPGGLRPHEALAQAPPRRVRCAASCIALPLPASAP